MRVVCQFEEKDPQGLKPSHSSTVFGMTEVMPCYKALTKSALCEPIRPVPFRLNHYPREPLRR
jgi:hypothetical protein